MTEPEQEPTTEQLQAVINFARRWGKGWKDRLLDCWWNASYDRSDDGPRLQQVRNQFGPEWLAKLPEEVNHK